MLSFNENPTSTFVPESITESLASEQSKFVTILNVNEEGFDIRSYIEDNISEVKQKLLDTGAILIRGLPTDIDTFSSICDLFGEVTSHAELSSPRTQTNKGVYTSTDHPADQKIQMHNEQSYLSYWPMVASFLCIIPSDEGGETPIADCRNFENELPPSLAQKLKKLGLVYVRNIGKESTIPWREVFSVKNEQELEDYCRDRGIDLFWKDGNPCTESKLPAFRRHPITNTECFFNNIVVASPHSLSEKDLHNLLHIYKDAKSLPINVFFGDGSEITEEDIGEIISAYDRRTFQFKWEKGDILIADNMLTAHSRNPFIGNRKILVRVNGRFDSLNDHIKE